MFPSLDPGGAYQGLKWGVARPERKQRVCSPGGTPAFQRGVLTRLDSTITPHYPCPLPPSAGMDVPKPPNISAGGSKPTGKSGGEVWILMPDLPSLLESLPILRAGWDRGSLLCEKSKNAVWPPVAQQLGAPAQWTGWEAGSRVGPPQGSPGRTTHQAVYLPELNANRGKINPSCAKSLVPGC